MFVLGVGVDYKRRWSELREFILGRGVELKVEWTFKYIGAESPISGVTIFPRLKRKYYGEKTSLSVSLLVTG